MRLTSFTDYGLRALMRCAGEPDRVFTTDEIAEAELRGANSTALVQARQEQGISQRQLAEMSHVQQPQIARMERGDANPQLSTILKVLAPLGMTLAVVPIK